MIFLIEETSSYKGESLSEDLKVNDTYDRYCDDCDCITSQKYKGRKDYNGRYAPEDMFLCTDCGCENYFKVEDEEESLKEDIYDYDFYDDDDYDYNDEYTVELYDTSDKDPIRKRFDDYKKAMSFANSQTNNYETVIVTKPGVSGPTTLNLCDNGKWWNLGESLKESINNAYVSRRLNAAADELSEILGEYGYSFSPDDMNLLSKEELEEIGRVSDMLHDVANLVKSQKDMDVVESLKESTEFDDPLDMAVASFESGHLFGADDFEDDQSYQEYRDYMEMGPVGFYEQFKDEIEFSPDFIEEYGEVYDGNGNGIWTDDDEDIEESVDTTIKEDSADAITESFDPEYGVDLGKLRPFERGDWYEYAGANDLVISDSLGDDKFLDPLIYDGDTAEVLVVGDDDNEYLVVVVAIDPEGGLEVQKGFGIFKDAVSEANKVSNEIEGKDTQAIRDLVEQGYEIVLDEFNK